MNIHKALVKDHLTTLQASHENSNQTKLLKSEPEKRKDLSLVNLWISFL